MFSTGQIGLWSVVEEGIGICAGSMPTLKPLLSLSIFGGSTNASKDPSLPLSASNHLKQVDQTDAVKMETIRSPRSSKNKQRGSTDDESMKHILKETHVTVTAETYNANDDSWPRNQVLGWDNRVGR